MSTQALSSVVVVVVVVLLAVWGCGPASSTRIDGICTSPASSSGLKRPRVSSVFRVNVECSMEEQNRTVFVREYFDYDNNRGRVTQYDNTASGDAFYDYNDDQIILVDTDSYKCAVGDLSSTDDRFMFGYRTNSRGMPHVFGASGALHFGNVPETYVGKTVVRGIVAHRWDSCQYSEALNATMKVSWYFSSRTEWDMQLGSGAVPLRATAVGKQYKKGSIVPFSHTYDLFRFEQYVYPEDFEIPVGVVCPGMVGSKPFPQIPPRFSFIGEILDFDRSSLTYLEEAYDSVAKINVFSYKRSSDVKQLTNMDRMLQVNDYNSGLAYVQDRVSGGCQVGPLGTRGYAFLHIVADGKVTMKTPAEFLTDDTTHFSYVGVRTTRGIPCELWVATTTQIQGYTSKALTVEWYFALPEDVEDWNTEATGWRIPVKFRMWNSGEDDPIYEFNVFYFDTSRPKLVSVDLGPCFSASQRQRITFAIDGKFQSAISSNIEMFKYALTSAVATQSGISHLRVTDIEVYYDVSAVLVSFDLLGKPTIKGDVSHVTPENDLTTAARLVNSSIASGSLQMSVGQGASVQTIVPMHTAADTGYAAGALAGLGVAMLVVGSAGGAGTTFFLVIKRSTS
ncbi:uncharacterized protein LOC143294212 [Babylonia areolata]|uniref:uncharacterized protein LOC143294212 n=1 Tax=Babylonia areolata TaxID=304850 RepID=UPI003FD2A942